MAYIGKFNIEEELLKVVRGQKTKLLAPEMIIYSALAKRAALQKRAGDAFAITED